MSGKGAKHRMVIAFKIKFQGFEKKILVENRSPKP
jgi:hypothetical protein